MGRYVAKPTKTVYRLPEIAAIWSAMWKDEVTEDDILEYAFEDRLHLHFVLPGREFEVQNPEGLQQWPGLIPENRLMEFRVQAPFDLKSAEAGVLLRGGMAYYRELTWKNLDGSVFRLTQKGGERIAVTRSDLVLLKSERDRFEKSTRLGIEGEQEVDP